MPSFARTCTSGNRRRAGGETGGMEPGRTWLTHRKFDHDKRATGIIDKNQHLVTFFHFFVLWLLTVPRAGVYKAITDEGGGAASD